MEVFIAIKIGVMRLTFYIRLDKLFGVINHLVFKNFEDRNFLAVFGFMSIRFIMKRMLTNPKKSSGIKLSQFKFYTESRIKY